jgi:hypothetical protein
MTDSGFNLPPGVFENDLPGNSDEDIAWENAREQAMREIVDVCECSSEVCEFAQYSPNNLWEGCSQKIVTVDWEIGEGDIGDCPFVEGRAAQIADEG